MQTEGVWSLEYSRVILGQDVYDENGQVTLRQAYVHVAMYGIANRDAIADLSASVLIPKLNSIILLLLSKNPAE